MAHTDTDEMVSSLRSLVAKPVVGKWAKSSSPFVLTPALQVVASSRPKKVPLLVLTPSQAIETPKGRKDAMPKAAAWPRLNDTPDREAARHAARMSLEQRIAELEVAVGAQDTGDWEPDGSEDVASATRRSGAFSENSASVHVLHPAPASKQNVSKSDETLKSTGAFAHPVGVRNAPPMMPPQIDVRSTGDRLEADTVNAEQLREIVTEVLHAELKGELGHHITQNMRLIVQREVRKALAEYLWD